MENVYTILLPKILTASCTPNPADINAKTVLSVTVTEETVYLDPYFYYSGELYAGEV